MFKNSQAFKFVIILTIISFIFIIPVHRSQASYAKCDSAFLNSLDEQALRDMCTTYKFYREGISGDYDCLSVSKKDLVSTVDRALSLTCPTPSCNGLIAFLDVFLHQEFKNSCVADLTKYCKICDESLYGEGVTKKKSQQDLLSEMAASQATELTEEAPCELNILGSGTALEKIWNAIKGIVDGNISLGGIIYFSFVLVRSLLVATIKVLFWFLVPIIKINPNGTITGFGGFINFLNINQNSTSLTLVQQLWGDFRNLANIGIILGVIFTALATIFRSEKYSWKKMLPKLLIVALLINFSLIIADMFVDISNYLSLSIFNQFSGDSLATTVVDGTICPAVKAFFNEGGNYAYLRAASLGLILAGILLFQFVGLVSYVLTRIVTLVVCLITSPIALLAFAFPGGEKLFDFWRQRFQQAIVVLPILAFALYLSFIFIITIINNLNTNIQPNQSGALITTLAYAGFVIAFAQLVRYVAKFLGVEQVEKGFQLAKKAFWGAAGFIGGAAIMGLTKGAVGSRPWETIATHFENSPNRTLYSVGRSMRNIKTKIFADQIKREKDYLSGLNPNQTRTYVFRNRNNPDLVALAMNHIQELGDTNIDDTRFINIAMRSRYFNPPSATRKNNIVAYTNSNFENDETRALSRATIRNDIFRNSTISDIMRNQINRDLDDQDAAYLYTASHLKTTDIQEQNWDDIWEHYLTNMTRERQRAFLFTLVLTQGTKLAYIPPNTRRYSNEIGRAIIDSTLDYLQTISPNADREDAKNYLLSPDDITLPGDIQIHGRGGENSEVFRSWITAN